MTNVAFPLALLLLTGAAPSPTPAVRTDATFRLYKFQQPIGKERSVLVTSPNGTIVVAHGRSAAAGPASHVSIPADARRAGEPLAGEFAGLYRLRVGDYRVIYARTSEGYLILRIGHREDEATSTARGVLRQMYR